MAGDDDDHYRTLGIGRGASKAEVKAAFCRLAQQHHPDRHHATSNAAAAARRFRRVYDAYSVLHDDAARATYDLRFRSSSSSYGGGYREYYRHGRYGGDASSSSSGPSSWSGAYRDYGGHGGGASSSYSGFGHTHGDANGGFGNSSSGRSGRSGGYRHGHGGGGSSVWSWNRRMVLGGLFSIAVVASAPWGN